MVIDYLSKRENQYGSKQLPSCHVVTSEVTLKCTSMKANNLHSIAKLYRQEDTFATLRCWSPQEDSLCFTLSVTALQSGWLLCHLKPPLIFCENPEYSQTKFHLKAFYILPKEKP